MKKNRLSLVKSPIELIFGTIRTLGTAGNDGRNFSWAVNAIEKFGQSLFNPPNIAGWPEGKEWLAGQSLERRLTELPKYFSRLDKESKQAVTNGVTREKMRQRLEKRAENIVIMSKEYQQDLADFFASGAEEQFLAETMVINWIPEDFATREYGDINVAFYNVSFMGRKWDGISVRFGTDVNSKKKQEWKNINRLGFKQGSSHPAAISNYNDGWVSDWDGHRGWETSFPHGPHEKFRKKKTRATFDEKTPSVYANPSRKFSQF